MVPLDERRRRANTRADCPRCKRRVALKRPWRGLRYARLVWFGALLGFLPLLPAMAFDACVMMPALMLFLLALGPLNELARRQPSCAQCGLPLGPPGKDQSAEVVSFAPRRRRRRLGGP